MVRSSSFAKNATRSRNNCNQSDSVAKLSKQNSEPYEKGLSANAHRSTLNKDGLGWRARSSHFAIRRSGSKVPGPPLWKTTLRQIASLSCEKTYLSNNG